MSGPNLKFNRNFDRKFQPFILEEYHHTMSEWLDSVLQNQSRQFHCLGQKTCSLLNQVFKHCTLISIRSQQFL